VAELSILTNMAYRSKEIMVWKPIIVKPIIVVNIMRAEMIGENIKKLMGHISYGSHWPVSKDFLHKYALHISICGPPHHLGKLFLWAYWGGGCDKLSF
jgi:hypothetical protein